MSIMGSNHDEQTDREIRESMPPITVAEANHAMIDEQEEPTQETFFISHYGIERFYGGPEEGGWWYDWWTFKRVRCTLVGQRRDAEALCRALNAAEDVYRRETRTPDRSSVLGGMDDGYTIDAFPGEHRSTGGRPHYE